MKKIFCVFFLALFLFGFGFDVAFGISSQAEADKCAADGGQVVGSECVMDQEGITEEKNAICKSSTVADYVGWSEEKQKCVTAQELCESLGMVADGDSCVELADYCHKQKQEFVKATETEKAKCKSCGTGEDYDPTARICFDPTVTPSTILPDTKIKETDCEKLFEYDSYTPGFLKEIVSKGEKKAAPDNLSGLMISPLDVLGCAIKTGRIRLWMVPFYIKYLIQFALSIAGLVAVGSIIIGGYFYLFGAFADDKDKGKRAIIYGIVGFIVAILAWTIVNVVIAILTR